MYVRPIRDFRKSQQLVINIIVESYVNEIADVSAPSMMSGNKEKAVLLCQKKHMHIF